MFMVINLLLCPTHCRVASENYEGKLGFQSMCFLEMHLSAQSSHMYAYTWVFMCAGSEQFIGVDVWYGLSPVTERAVLWHEKGLVLLFTQEREHMLHKLTQSAITTEETTEWEIRKTEWDTEGARTQTELLNINC